MLAVALAPSGDGRFERGEFLLIRPESTRVQKINEADLDWDEYDHGEQFFRRKRLSDAVGAEDGGCSLYELPPGKRSRPYHYHAANEEAVYVLAGVGQGRGEDGTVRLEAGDYVTLPANESGGHQLVNDGDAPLRYLMVSTMTAVGERRLAIRGRSPHVTPAR